MNIIELAKEAGFEDFAIGVRQEQLERFAALVRTEWEWVDLTDDEIENCALSHSSVDFGRAVTAAFKEKNK